MIVDIGVHIYGFSAAEYQRVYDAPVYVSRQYYLVSRLARGKYHALYGGCSPSYHEISVRRAESVRRQLLRLIYNGYRVTEIVERLHGIYVKTDALLTQKLDKLRVSSAALVSRHIEGNYPLFSESFERLVERRGFLLFYIHFLYYYPPSEALPIFPGNKKQSDTVCITLLPYHDRVHGTSRL